jgi:hypothetical protein
MNIPDGIQWCDLTNTGMNTEVPKQVGNVLQAERLSASEALCIMN